MWVDRSATIEISELKNKLVVIVITMMSIRQCKGDVNSTTIHWLKLKTQGFLFGMVSAFTNALEKSNQFKTVLSNETAHCLMYPI
jgi:hypothetical protein